VSEVDDTTGDGSARPAHLRLVWSNPSPLPPRRPLDLAVAIERHLSGRFGLSDEEFARVFALSRSQR
jgi:hypothetical protein